MVRNATIFLTIVVAVSCVRSGATAQPADPTEERNEVVEDRGDTRGEEGPVMTPPAVQHEAPIEWPVNLLGLEPQEVTVQVTLDTTGAVQDVEVVAGVSAEVDELVVAAVRATVFQPATRDGEAIAAQFGLRYVVPAVPFPVGDLVGVVHDPQGRPAQGLTVRLSAQDVASGPDAVADQTAEDGTFSFRDLVPGTYMVEVSSGTKVVTESVERVVAGQATDVTYRLVARQPKDTGPAGFGAKATVDAPPREVVRRTIPKEHLTVIPGTRGDPLRAVELLPGVGRPAFGAGELIIRGSAPGDSEIFFEGATAPLLYHFGGLTSVVNGSLLESVDLYPGNFSARFGRRTGGILDVSFRDPATDGFHVRGEFSFIDTYLVLEGPVSETVSVAVAARRSLIDIVIARLDSDAIGVVAAPVYYDYQFLGSWRPSDRDQVRWFIYGANDRTVFNQTDPGSGDPTLRGRSGLTQRFTNVQLEWRRQISNRTTQELMVAYAPVTQDFSAGEIGLDALLHQVQMRAEWRMRLGDRLHLITGADIQTTPFNVDYNGPNIGPQEGGGSLPPIDPSQIISVVNRGVLVRPAGYVEFEILPIEKLRIVAGLRVDYFSEIDSVVVDPRLTTVYSVSENLRIKGGVGLYSQPPSFVESIAEVGNPDLDPIRSVHVGGGIEWDFRPGMLLDVEGFYKYLWNRVVGLPGGVPPFYQNGGIGRIYGLELSLQLAPDDLPFFGYLSYTYSRSERRDLPGDAWRLFDFDQPHVLTASFVYLLPKGWSIGATFRLVSGNPATPVIGSVYNASTGVYTPVDGRLNSVRDATFHRLDFRVEKKWELRRGGNLAFFIDIRNLYNRRNQEGLSYNYDYTDVAVTGGLPIIPSIGIRGER